MWLIACYTCLTLMSLFPTYQTITSPAVDYRRDVRNVLTTVLFYHATIVALFLTIDMPIMRSPYFSVVSTSMSIFLSLCFYWTDPNSLKLRYLFNFGYLFFASILVSELWLYFGNRDSRYGLSLLFLMFVLDRFLYTRDRRVTLIGLYVAMIAIATAIGSQIGSKMAYGMLLNGLYGLAIFVWMYIDHDKIKTDQSRYPLDDALKYFYDLEGFVVRYLSKTTEKN